MTITINDDNKKTICPVPWMHLAFEPNGLVIPCCLTSVENYCAGDLKTHTIEEIWNSDNMKKLRQEMTSGIEPSACRKCFDREKVTGESSRTYHIRDFPSVITKIPEITAEDGTCSEMKLKYWDFRFSNLCNFKCRSCGPRYSSSWVPDAKKLGIINEQEKVWYIESVNQRANFDFLDEQVKYVEKIYFAGGEPLLMDEHWQILDMLIANNRFDVTLNYNTNCSTLVHNKKNVIDYWKQWNFGKIEIWASIDEIEDRAELIRSGTVWSKVEENLKELVKYDNIIVRPGITVGAWNVARLPEIITHLVEIGVIREKLHYSNFFINLIEHPTHYHVHILPVDTRLEIINKLQAFITDHNTKYNTNITELFTHIIHELKKPQSIIDTEKFISITSSVDAVRGEKLYEIIPEMQVVLPPIVQHNPTPIIHKDKNIIKIEKTSKPLSLTWVLNNICTNKCSYCPPSVHNGSNHHYEWEHAKTFIATCFEKYSNIHCSISGGEPTVSPFFKDLVNLIYDNGGTVILTTNLARTKEYWYDISDKFCSISISYHPEYIVTQAQEDEFIDKIKYISEKTYATVRIMMHPEHWDRCFNIYQTISDFNCCNVEMVRILPNFGVGEAYCSINYTPEQDTILRTTTPHIRYKHNIKTLRRDPSFSFATYDDESTVALSFETTTAIMNNKSNNFKGWECGIGLESLFVNYDGNVQRGNCGVGGIIGNIANDIDWPNESVTCNKSECHCVADLLISKRIQ